MIQSLQNDKPPSGCSLITYVGKCLAAYFSTIRVPKPVNISHYFKVQHASQQKQTRLNDAKSIRFYRLTSGTRWRKWLERGFTDWKVRGSNPISASRLPLSRLGQPGSIPALVLPLGGMAARQRKGATAERFFSR
ncbi:hypothetical protein CSKR_101578 [Clonorchis sinensis]|uniref:Uncharacterized protein n=1 Tax=Clonorchis sinensis TaxID=79923 RepID=A0A3R7DAZ6_CLOSI|nr:hypothetical protein CSKR_101578 [Clonorchis sinensis]